MKNVKKTARRQGARGFTILELLIATAIFLVIAGAALSLFSVQQPLLNRQQNFAGLNIAMRNTVAQLQLDVVNAGTGYYPGTNIPDWPVGVTIVNSNPASACNTASTFTYSSTCFDQLNIISTDANTPPAHPVASDGVSCVASTASPIYVYPPAGTTAATLAADYQNGDELLLVDTSNSKMTTIKVTAAPASVTVGGNPAVKLVFSVTNANGTNSATNDPLSITTSSLNTKLNTGFCPTDWILRLAPITYTVDTSTASNPKLVRTQAGSTSTLAEQIIGFKVGAVAWNATDDTSAYSYVSSDNNAANACSAQSSTPIGYCNQWWLIRSVQVSLIARTTPVTDPTYTYRNGFDGGHYQIESEMAVINPRNMSMNNN